MKFQWSDKLYVSDNLKKREKKIRLRMEKEKFSMDIFLLTLPTNRQNQLDIFPSVHLNQAYIKAQCPPVIGLAKGYNKALELVLRITKDCYRERRDVKIREYLEDRMKR